MHHSSHAASTSIPESAQQIVATVIEHYQQDSGLCWIHGQGSVFSRFTDLSDLDFVIVWDTRVPNQASLTAGLHPRMTSHEAIALEQASLAGYDLDVMHVPRSQFDDWQRQIRAGEGWIGTDWPLPIYAVSGFVHGTILLDPDGNATRLQDDHRRPPAQLVESAQNQLAAALPTVVVELQHCASRGDHWLHRSLTVRRRRLEQRQKRSPHLATRYSQSSMQTPGPDSASARGTRPRCRSLDPHGRKIPD